MTRTIQIFASEQRHQQQQSDLYSAICEASELLLPSLSAHVALHDPGL